MTNALYRLGHLAARRPWRVIGAWLAISIVVIGASERLRARAGGLLRGPRPRFDRGGRAAHRRPLRPGRADRPGRDDPPRSPDRLPRARPRRWPSWRRSTNGSAASTTWWRPATRPACWPRARRPPWPPGAVSPDGRVALVRVQYPVLEDLTVADFERLDEAVAEAREGSSLCRSSGAASCRPSSRRGRARAGRDHRPGRRRHHPAAGLRVGDRHGPADRHGPVRAGRRHQLHGAHHLPDRHPQLGSPDGHHDRPRRRHRLRPVPGDPPPGAPGPGPVGGRLGWSGRGHRRPGGHLRRRHRGHRHPGPGGCRRALRDRGRCGHLGHRADHGAGLDHHPAGPPGPGRTVGSTASASTAGATRPARSVPAGSGGAATLPITPGPTPSA